MADKVMIELHNPIKVEGLERSFAWSLRVGSKAQRAKTCLNQSLRLAY